MLKEVRSAIFTDFTAVASEPQIMTVLEAALLWQRDHAPVPNRGRRDGDSSSAG